MVSKFDIIELLSSETGKLQIVFCVCVCLDKNLTKVYIFVSWFKGFVQWCLMSYSITENKYLSYVTAK